MSKEITKKENNEIKVNNEEIISSIVLNGDLSKLTPIQKVEYYNNVCQSLGLNPLTKPFDIIKIQGKEVLYAKRDCTEQLRKINGISVVDQDEKILQDIYIVNVKVQDKTGRIDTGKGAVSIISLKGDTLANAMMKAETKAKRRATLSISGMGITDETELEAIPEFIEKKVFSNIKKSEPELTDIADDTPGFEDIEIIGEKGSTPWDEQTASVEIRRLATKLKPKMSPADIDYFTKLFNSKDKYTQDQYLFDLDYLSKIEAGKKDDQNTLFKNNLSEGIA